MDLFALVNIMIIVFYCVLVFSTLVEIILSDHEPAENVAWIMFALFVPILGLLLYYFFGQDFRMKRKMGQKGMVDDTHYIEKSYKANVHLLKEGYSRPIISDERDEVLIRFFENYGYSIPFTAKANQFFTSGTDFFTSLISDIDHAQHHVHVEFFIIEEDNAGKLLKEALIKAVQRGVEVRVMYDDVGSWSTSNRYFRQMRKEGILTSVFMPVRFHRLAHRINYRNHRKMVVIDGKVGYIGGMNIADRYMKDDWRDMQMRMEGSAVLSLQLLFLTDWKYATGKDFQHRAYYPPLLPSAPQDVVVQVLASAPFSKWPIILRGYVRMIQGARQSILLQTPYFMPTPSVIEALQTAAMSGVNVQIMVPRDARSFWMNKCNQSYFRDMLNAGVQMFIYEKGMLHSKMLVVDNHILSVGSVNLDFRSLLTTFESTAIVYSDEKASEASRLFEEAKQQCTLLSEDEWNQRSLKSRFVSSALRLLSPMF